MYVRAVDGIDGVDDGGNGSKIIFHCFLHHVHDAAMLCTQQCCDNTTTLLDAACSGYIWVGNQSPDKT